MDLLGRRPLARAIAEVVANTPVEFGVRVGLFGEWGSGKTSVLNFVREILEARDHIVVEFSPWGIADEAELWTRFGQRLLEQLRVQGKTAGSVFSRFMIKHQNWISGGTQVIKELAGRASPVGGVAPALDFVRGLLAATRERVKELANPATPWTTKRFPGWPVPLRATASPNGCCARWPNYPHTSKSSRSTNQPVS